MHPGLTVWVGPKRYVFPPGRDVMVGCTNQCDVRLDLADQNPVRQPIPYLVLKFTGTHWMAIDQSRNGMFVDGVPTQTAIIRDGLAITIGDRQRGPRLVFQLAPTNPSPPQPIGLPEHAMPERTTTPIRLTAPRPPPKEQHAQPAKPSNKQPKNRGLVERLNDASRKLRQTRPATSSAEIVPPTERLSLTPGTRTIGMAAYQLRFATDGNTLLANVSFSARPGTLTAVIGPSAARNSALLGLLAGTRHPTSGVVAVDGHDVHAEPMAMRSRIGLVARDNHVHPHLTVGRALQYTAELRLPPGTSTDVRNRVVDQILDELALTPYRDSLVAKLPPEARRCAAISIEVLTRPSLLVVDEPHAALDPVRENHIMAVLRRQADLGCAVVVATTSVAYLNKCDQVLVLTSAGTPAFAGPPAQVTSAMGTAEWPDVVAQAGADPQGTHRAFLTRQQPSAPELASPAPRPAELTMGQQIRLMTRRQARLLVGDRIYFLFLALLPLTLGALTLLIPGDSGLGRADPSGRNPHEAIAILATLNIAAVIMGIALSFRDLVSQRRIFRREQAVGLSASAYLAGKIIVFSVAAAIQAAIVTFVVVQLRGGPVHGAVLLRNPDVELYASVAATAVVSAIVGLTLSSVGKSVLEVLPLTVPVILASFLFAGGLDPLVGTWGFDQLSWLVPAQWGFAASASTVDLRRVDTLATHTEVWTHYSGWWVFDMIMLVSFGAFWAGFVWYRLRPVRREISAASRQREQQERRGRDG